MKNRFLFLFSILTICVFASCEEEKEYDVLPPSIALEGSENPEDGYPSTISGVITTQTVIQKIELFKGEELFQEMLGEELTDRASKFTFEYTPVTSEVGSTINFSVVVTDVEGQKTTPSEVAVTVLPGPPTLTFTGEANEATGVTNRDVTISGSIYSPTPLTEVMILKVVGEDDVNQEGVTVDLAAKTFTYTYTVEEGDFDEATRAPVEFTVAVKNEGLGEKATNSYFDVNVLSEKPLVHFALPTLSVVAYDTAIISGNIELREGLVLDKIVLKHANGTEIMDAPDVEEGKELVTVDLENGTFLLKYPVTQDQVGDLSISAEAVTTEGEGDDELTFNAIKVFDFKVTTALPSIAFTGNITAVTVKVGNEFTLSGKVTSAHEVTSFVIKMDGVALAEDDVTFDPATGMFSYTMEVGDEAKDVEFAVEAVNKTTGEAGKAMETFTLTISGNDI